MTYFINLLTLSRIFLGGVIFLLLTRPEGYFLAFMLFFVEIFPLKTTGSFFTTGNASFVFLLIAVIVGFSNKLIYFKKKQI